MKRTKTVHPIDNQHLLGAIAELIDGLKEAYPNDWKDIPVFIGDDEELNGIHIAGYADSQDTFENLVAEIKTKCPHANLGSNDVVVLIS